MKVSFILLTFFMLASSGLFAADIKDVDISGYMRAGVGTNTFGGDHECFYNSGAGGSGVGRNEFRLGNECSNFLEVAFRFNHIKTETKNVYTQFRFNNSHNGHDSGESASQSTNFVEAFAEIQGMNDLPLSFWVGKRFYREQDVHIDDYFYFASLSGNGAGFGNLDLLNGKFSFAYIKQVTDTKTNIGKQNITVYDARLKGVPLTSSLKQNFWAAFGHAPESTNSTSGAKYLKSRGYVVGSLLEWDLNGSGFNHTAIMYGQGLMNNFNLYGNSTITAGNIQSSERRLRLINHTTYNINELWAFHLSLNHERYYVKTDTKEQWSGVTVRPIYRITPTFHLVTEAGTSLAKSTGDTKRLSRLTVAPQLGFTDNIWGRPVLRAFYTHSFWSANNKASIATNAPTYANKTAGGAYGFQMESNF